MMQILYEIHPNIYEPCQNLEECIEKLATIENIVKSKKYVFYQRRHRIEHIAEVEWHKGIINIRRGNNYLSFKIERI